MTIILRFANLTLGVGPSIFLCKLDEHFASYHISSFFLAMRDSCSSITITSGHVVVLVH